MKHLSELLGESPGIEAVRDKIKRLLTRQQDARRLPPVLIEGETGTGKGLLARLIHRAGPRPDGPFVDVNCAAIPETLLEAEMFGFERGAFTDARRAKPGLLQTAHGGTIFLDEVGLLSEGLQAKLLKVLEGRTVRRLGSTRDEAIDVWILTATNEDLKSAIQGRRFREDLYHRLAVLTLTLPPLRDRAGDILMLAEHYLARARIGKYGVRAGEAPAPPPRPERRPARRVETPPVAPEAAPPPPPVIVAPPASAPLEWERRRVTMLRASLLAPSAPEALLETNRALELVVDKVRSFGGTIEGRGPTGIAAAFGLDLTEDAPSRAAHTAMAMVNAVTRARQDAGSAPAIKVAVHTSQILVGRGAGAPALDLEGKQAALIVLNTLVERGGADSVMVSEATAPFLTRGFEFLELRGEEFARGRAYTLLGRGRTGPGHAGRASTFVGRNRELELL